MGVSDTTEKDWEEHYKWQDCFEDYVRANSYKDISGYVINMNKVLEGIGHYNHCENCSTESKISELSEEILKLNQEIKLLQSNNQSLKNMIVKMCYDRYGE